MLTKDLIRFRNLKGTIKPTWIKKNDDTAFSLADCLVTLFEQHIGSTKRALQEQTGRLLENCPLNNQVAKGLTKLMWDRCRFAEPANEDMIAQRDQVFESANALMAQGPWPSLEAYREAVAAQQQTKPAELDQQLYSDLEMYQPLEAVREITGDKLIARYNAALVQSLLLQAESVTITLPVKDLAVLRDLFRHLKFHQLMVAVKDTAEGYQLTLDGPLSLFQQTKRYGMNLARFFPALLHQKKWSLAAEIRIRGKKPGVLLVDQSHKLQPYTQATGAYVPESFELLIQSVQEKVPGWQAEAGTKSLQLPNGDFVFPDFVLTHGDMRVYLELFHRWHRGALRNRLKANLAESGECLILGVDTHLTRDKEMAKELAANAYFQSFGFSFRDIPTVTKLKPILKRLAE
ncbi:DUF790 family protein [Acanthopleuribacter pedis]|uniref:DUF790 family protein n=1 Tax=Acanthopleuribacter pedis TaxID=442870 RepID=A0A8J7Q7W0_9BACT|nr:DUF790 family protein [Acanthopleuribacter pedis]MBO1318999.1 DUF790 family protein [Acanthopleuribacter pedis]